MASICCITGKGEPYSFSCFYAFCSETQLLFFKSSTTSYHINLLLKNHTVSGTVLPDSLNTIKFRGIQFIGKLVDANKIPENNAAKKYHQKFPFAIAVSGTVFTIELSQVKMTGSILGKRQKFEWQRNIENCLG